MTTLLWSRRLRWGLALLLALGVLLLMQPLTARAESGNTTSPAAPQADGWSEDFDSYAADSSLHGQGGWQGWDNSSAATAYVRTTYARSAPNAAAITGASDLVHTYSNANSGLWIYTAWQYIPTGVTGGSYFILLNQYTDGGPYNWSTQVRFDADTNQVVNEGVTGGSLSLIRDRWVEIRVEIDLDSYTQHFYYDGDLLFQGSWTNEQSGSGSLNIAAVDLFANTGTAYYDNLSMVQVVNEASSINTGGDWDSFSTWAGGGIPSSTAIVTITANTTVTVNSNAQCYTLTIESGCVLVIPDGITLNVEHQLVNNGTLRQIVNSVPAGSPTAFLHIQNVAATQNQYWGLVITPTDSAMGVVTVTLKGAQDCGTGGTPVQRCFVIEPTNPTTATLQFYYRAVETNTNTSPLVWHWSGAAWQLVATALDTAWGGSGDALWVRITQGSTYSPFVLADTGQQPTALILRGLTARPTGAGVVSVIGMVILSAGAVIFKRKR